MNIHGAKMDRISIRAKPELLFGARFPEPDPDLPIRPAIPEYGDHETDLVRSQFAGQWPCSDLEAPDAACH